MNDVTVRELRNHGGDVVDRVIAGERLIVTKAGKPVAELCPLPRSGLDAAALLSRWHKLPLLDADSFFWDIAAHMDAAI